MVGVDRAVEVGPGGFHDLFVRRAEGLQDGDGLVAGRLVGGQLDVGQHPVGVRVGHQQRPGFASGCGGELVAVDQAGAGFDRVDTEARPGHVEERHRRTQVAVDVVTGAEVAHRAFEHEWRPGHGVEDLAMFAGRGHERVGDLGVDLVEGVGAVVEVVERGGVSHEIGRRMDRGAQVAVRGMFDRSERLDGDVVATARTQADDDDAWSFGGGHGQPKATTWPEAASKVPYRGST